MDIILTHPEWIPEEGNGDQIKHLNTHIVAVLARVVAHLVAEGFITVYLCVYCKLNYSVFYNTGEGSDTRSCLLCVWQGCVIIMVDAIYSQNI